MDKRCTFLILILILISLAVRAQKIDTIYHINSNVLTGDFKKMEYGVVTWKMDGMGTISLEEVKVNTIKSPKQFEIKLKNGFIYFGSLDTSGYDRKINVVLTNGRELIDLDEIVEIYPIRRSFWLRTSGNFSLGANYSKGSSVATVAFSGNLNYRKRKSSYYFSWDNNNTFQADTLSATKANASIAWERLVRKKWSMGTILGTSNNSELGNKLRIDFTVLGILDIVYNNWTRFYSAAGLSVQRETPYDTSGVSNDLAGIVTLIWKVYKYTNPKIWVDADISYVPYFTSAGRYRLNLNLSPKVSIIGNDMKIGFRFYYTYDNKPTSILAATDDWGINLEITYSLH
ncbi:MAG: hypothetical protein L3J66_02840 [Bacteroidales bacterium]|nr:hypothetical protein [Bacteroidales bacterium]